MTTHNDLERIKTPLLARMIDSFLADFGRMLTKEEYVENRKTLRYLQVEMDARNNRKQAS